MFDRFELKNVRCFREATVPLDPKLTIVIGGNGTGKTTLVEALSSLSYGDEEGLSAFPSRRNTNSGSIALYEKGKSRPSAQWTRSAKAEKRKRLPEGQFLLAYGRYRRVFYDDGDSGQPALSPTAELDHLAKHAGQDRTATLNRPDNNLLRDLGRYLVALHAGRRTDPRLEIVWTRLNESLNKLEAGLEGVRIHRGRYAYVPMIVRNQVDLELRELSDGYQALLVVIFDMIIRYAYLFPALEDPLTGHGLIIVDEVDLHLHPRWQRTVVGQLLSLFPGTQFVLTTHSPLVVQGAIDQKRTVVRLTETKGAVTARRLGPATIRRLEGAEVGSVLFDEKLFGLSSRYSQRYSQVENNADRLQQRVRRGAASSDDYDELNKNLATLEGLVAKEDERRADGSTVSQIARLQSAFAKSLLRELKQVKKEERS